MTISAPLITIGITAYNAEDTISNAIESALNQDWSATEIIIVDDASQDDTLMQIEPFLKAHSNIKFFSLPENKGVAAARNRIIQEAGGEFIAFFDDDDESAPDRLTVQHERITKYKKEFVGDEPVLCFSSRTQNYPDGTERIEPTMGTAEGEIAPHGEAVARRILTGKPAPNIFGSIATCSQMGFTEEYRRLGSFDEEFRRGEDTEYNIRFALAGGHFVGVKRPLVIQRMTYGTEKSLEQERIFFIRALEKHAEFVQQFIMLQFAKDWINVKYIYLKGDKKSLFISILRLFFKNPIRVIERIIWALPNQKFNVQFAKFHKAVEK